MHALLQSLTIRRFLLEQAPPIIASFIIAELFYKFHSFTWECLAFLATWYLLDAVTAWIRRLMKKNLL